MLDASAAMKARAAQGEPAGRAPARRQEAGDGVRPALDPHPGLLRRGHARARRRDPDAHGRRDAARPRRDHRRHRPRAVALRRRDHDPHPRPRPDAGTRRVRHRAGDQRAHQGLASLPDHGRHPHLRGASRADPGRTVAWSGDANNVWRAGSTRRRGSASPSTSRRRRSSRPARRSSPGRRREGGARQRHHRSVRGGGRGRRRSSPIAGSRWATTTTITATISSAPIR